MWNATLFQLVLIAGSQYAGLAFSCIVKHESFGSNFTSRGSVKAHVYLNYVRFRPGSRDIPADLLLFRVQC